MPKGKLINCGSYSDFVHSHNDKLKIDFGIRIGHETRKDNRELKEVGRYRPGTFEFTFRKGIEPNSIEMSEYSILDKYGRSYLIRRRKKSGYYSIITYDVDASIKTELSKEALRTEKILQKQIRRDKPEHFLFTSDPLFHALFRQRERKESEKAELSISPSSSSYLGINEYVYRKVRRLLNEISYVGPIRQKPERLYEISGDMPENVGMRGEFAPEIIFRKKNSDMIKFIEEWLHRFDVGHHIKCEPLSPEYFSLNLKKSKESPLINIADAGFGVSQVLPLIVQGYFSEKENLIIAEQPEIHLNPKSQVVLADLFSNLVNLNKGVIVETHSEHLILRIRRLISEGQLESKNVALYFVEKKQNISNIREVPIQKNGHIEMEHWPKGFFEDSLRESLGLARAQAKEDK